MLARIVRHFSNSRRSSVFIVNCVHTSNFVLIIDFGQAHICLVHIEKEITFEDKVKYVMRYAVVFQVWTKFIEK